ncbi:MAG: hypothetical protein KY476_02110 [Planctomycetes bacterium]|nr:hypothetical protein [Planctomycetota bacterium]
MNADAPQAAPSTAAPPAADAREPRAVRRLLPWRRRLLFAAALLILVAAGVGLAERLFWAAGYGVPVIGGDAAERVWSYYYPELAASGVASAEIDAADETFDVLLLGASVLEQVTPEFRRRLDEQLGGRSRVFALSRAAHTSRDSLLKFRRIGARPFDLIVIYHGINDARMNCTPPGTFRDDYTHCGWYASFERRLQAGSLTMLDVLGDRADSAGIALGEPDAELRRYGLELKTPPAFRRNMEEIVRDARDRDIPVLLMTFACYIPDDYSEEAFAAGRLDYGPGSHRLRAETWGNPEAVEQAVAAHNRELRELASQYENVTLVAQETLLPHDGRHFSDPCHLTDRGISVFVDHLLPVVLEQAQTGGRATQ